jgi:hypothetical protein
LRQVLLEHPLRRWIAVGLLERHAGGAEAVGRHGIAVARVEEVVRVVVEVRDAPLVELALHRGAVDVVDPGHGRLGDLVVDGIGVGREEVRRRAHLVRVDEQHARVAAQQLDLAVGLGLGAREPVAVHVEAVGVAARVRLAAVGVLDRQDHHDRRVEDPLGRAVGAVGELVEHAQRRVGAALLAAVHVARDPEDRGIRGGDPRRVERARARIHQLRRARAHGGQAGARHALGPADDRIAQRPPLVRGRRHAARHAGAGPVDREQVAVGLGRGDVAVTEVDADHLLGGRDLPSEARRREGVAVLSGGRRRSDQQCAGGERAREPTPRHVPSSEDDDDDLATLQRYGGRRWPSRRRRNQR